MLDNKIDCKKIYDDVVEKIKAMSSEKKMSYVCYLVADENGVFDSASERYVSLKHKTSEECGVECEIKRMTQEQFIKEMIVGSWEGKRRAMLQLPAPETCIKLFEANVYNGRIFDVDNLDNEVMFDMVEGNFDRAPATAEGAIAILEKEFYSLEGKKIAVVGSRSKTVGRFLPLMLQAKNATVSMYHSRSLIYDNEFEQYDAIISCVGKESLIKNKHLGKRGGKVLIDIGVSFVDGKVRGDFDIDVREKNRYTAWTGAMGTLTRAFLVDNVANTYR